MCPYCEVLQYLELNTGPFEDICINTVLKSVFYHFIYVQFNTPLKATKWQYTTAVIL